MRPADSCLTKPLAVNSVAHNAKFRKPSAPSIIVQSRLLSGTAVAESVYSKELLGRLEK